MTTIAAVLLVTILINVAAYNVENTIVIDNKIITSNTFSDLSSASIASLSSNLDETKSYPDVYYIILDGYMSSSSLKEFLNYDNQEFVSYLTNKGFDVNHKSYSNYPSSVPSVIST